MQYESGKWSALRDGSKHIFKVDCPVIEIKVRKDVVPAGDAHVLPWGWTLRDGQRVLAGGACAVVEDAKAHSQKALVKWLLGAATEVVMRGEVSNG